MWPDSDDVGEAVVHGVAPCDLVLALGPGWIRCTDALPWSDCRAWLLYVVYSPSYCGDLLICEFRLGSGWWHEGLNIGISGVTHWRLALDDDEDFSKLRGGTPVTAPLDPVALSELRHWWSWYRAHYGDDDE